jgi:ABC-type lipoprotein release transport system permease subunit
MRRHATAAAMRSTAVVATAQFRTRGLRLVALALTIGLVGTVVLTAFAGSRRTSGALRRLRTATLDSDVTITRFGTLTDQDQFAERLRRSPAVAAVATWQAAILLPQEADSETDGDFALVNDPDGVIGVDVDRPLLVAGRRPDPDAVDEVLLSEPAARAFGLDVGDHLLAGSLRAATVQCVLEAACEFPDQPDGPPIDLTIVGIGRRPDEIRGAATRSGFYGLPSVAFAREVGPQLGTFASIASVRLLPDSRARAAFERDLQRILRDVPNADVLWADTDYVQATQSSFDALALALLVFGGVAAVAGLVALAQMTNREMAAAERLQDPLRAIGSTRLGRTAALSAPLLPAVIAGSVLAGLGAIAASALMPIGLARQAEPHPGMSFDPVVQFGGVLGLAAGLTAWAVYAAWRASMAARGHSAPRSFFGGIAAAGSRPEASVGLGYAFSSRAGTTGVPVRSALVAAAFAVTGLVGAAVVVTSVDSLSRSPARFGYTWSTRPDGTRPDDGTLASSLGRDERIAAFGFLHTGEVVAPNGRLRAYAIEDVTGVISPMILRGRQPANPREIAVGESTLRAWHLDVGHAIQAEPLESGTPVSLTIVGVAVIPPIEEDAPGRGAFLTTEGLEALDRSAHTEAQPILRYAPGIDVAATEQDLERLGFDFNVYSRPALPSAVRNLQRSEPVLAWLAVFLALLGSVGLAHALVVSTRRRAGEVAALRAIGFVPRQARATVRWQSIAIVAAAVMAGIPLGLIVGRQVWNLIVGHIGVLDDASVPWAALAAVPLGALAVGLAIAWIPARTAGRLRVASVLRAE